MTKSQFRRLTLVLLVPLILAGAFLYERGIGIQDTVLECSQLDGHFLCTPIPIAKGEKYRYFETSGGVLIGSSARLSDGFSEAVTTLGLRQEEYRDGKMQPTGVIVGGGVEKQLVLASNTGANFTGNGTCRLTPFANSETDWSLSCVQNVQEMFKFSNPESAKKFKELWEIVVKAENESSKSNVISSIVPFLLPFVAYLLMVGFVYMLSKTVRYVRQG